MRRWFLQAKINCIVFEENIKVSDAVEDASNFPDGNDIHTRKLSKKLVYTRRSSLY